MARAGGAVVSEGLYDIYNRLVRGERVAAGERVLVTVLTKRMAEDLTQYLAELNIRVRYLHSEVATLERTVILYADRMTDSMRKAIDETERRRAVRAAYNQEHGIEPRTIIKDIASPLLQLSNLDNHDAAFLPPRVGEEEIRDDASLAKLIAELEREMKAAARRLEFEQAAQLRDRIKTLRAQQIYKT
jgi:excinuclease UvrABC helicase subunit UvrB